MFDWPLDWIALLVAIAAVIIARKSSDELARLRTRLDRLEAERGTHAMMPPPLPEFDVAPIVPDAAPPAAVAADQPSIVVTEMPAPTPEPVADTTQHEPPPMPPTAPPPMPQA